MQIQVPPRAPNQKARCGVPFGLGCFCQRHGKKQDTFWGVLLFAIFPRIQNDKAGPGFRPSAGGYHNLKMGGDMARVIRIAYQVSEAYPGFRWLKVRCKTCNLYAVLKKFTSFFPMTVDIFDRNAEFYDQMTAACVFAAVHTPAIDIEVSEPAEVTDRKPPPHTTADRTPVRELANRTAAAPAGPPVAAPARIRTEILDPSPTGHGAVAGKGRDHIVCQNRRLAGVKLSHRNSRL